METENSRAMVRASAHRLAAGLKLTITRAATPPMSGNGMSSPRSKVRELA